MCIPTPHEVLGSGKVMHGLGDRTHVGSNYFMRGCRGFRGWVYTRLARFLVDFCIDFLADTK